MGEYYPQYPQAQPMQPMVDFNAPSGLWLTVGGAEKLKTIASWSKFFSVLMLIYLILMFIGGIAMFIGGFTMPPRVGFAITIYGAVYLIMGVIMLFPTVAYLKFANKAKRAYKLRDNVSLQDSLGSMAFALQYWGVLAIIFIVLSVILIVAAVCSGLSNV